jgi:hypothetical protein
MRFRQPSTGLDLNRGALPYWHDLINKITIRANAGLDLPEHFRSDRLLIARAPWGLTFSFVHESGVLSWL